MEVPSNIHSGLAAFANQLLSTNARARARVTRPDYGALNGKLVQIAVIDVGFKLGECWYNVAKYVFHHNKGRIVYGWSIWEDESSYLAQHHAVWQDADGKLIDVTPNKDGKDRILFVPDARVPFEMADDGVRFPPNFRKYKAGRTVWEAVTQNENSRTEVNYWIARCELDNIEPEIRKILPDLKF